LIIIFNLLCKMPSYWEEQFKSQIFKCDCGSMIHPNNKYSHCKTKYHIEKIKIIKDLASIPEK
jgi:hypothetical protein